MKSKRRSEPRSTARYDRMESVLKNDVGESEVWVDLWIFASVFRPDSEKEEEKRETFRKYVDEYVQCVRVGNEVDK